jgi:hypothetical protein
MKSEALFNDRWVGRCQSILVASGVLLGLGSCALPPKEAWQKMREEGIAKAFFPARRTAVGDDGTRRLAGADLSVDARGTKQAVVPPLALAAEVPGCVYSPHTAPGRLVNVSAFSPGETALCPYTFEPFVVPGEGTSSRVAVLDGDAGFVPSEPLPEPSSSHPDEATVPTDHPAVREVVTLPGTGPDAPKAPSPQAPLPAPMGSWVAGKPGLVHSPFAARHQLVDVTGLATGDEVFCPYSGRIFRVPAGGVDPVSPAVAARSGEPPIPVTAVADVAGATATPAAPTEAEPAATGPASAPVHQPPPASPPTVGAKYGAIQPPTPPVPAGGLATTTPPGVGATTPATPASPATPPKPADVPPPPTAAWVPGRPGLVQSPFGKPGELVDVTGRPTGTRVICPYTSRPFLVPAP